MAEKMVKIGAGFEMPLDELVVRRLAILAKTGAGKSNTGKVIVEPLLKFGAQVVILDPVGHWWGLRSLFAIPVLGGMSGDVPLDHLAGKLIARAVVESGQSMVLDVSGMDSDGQMQRFAKDFAKTLYDLKQAHPTAMLLVLEEADEFAPQDTRGGGVPEMVGAFARIAKRGRGRGIGLLSITLRSAALSKNVLNQTDTLIAMRTTAPLDLKAVREWLEYVELADGPAILASLPGLPTGTGWFVSPEAGFVTKVAVRKAQTLDTSATPKVGDVPPDIRQSMKPIDLAALGAEMASMAEKARQDDPAELRKEVAALKRQLAERPAGEAKTVEVPVEVEVEVIREVPVFSAEELEALKAIATTVNESIESMRPTHERIAALIVKANEAAAAVMARPARLPPRPVAPRPSAPIPETSDPRGRGASRRLPLALDPAPSNGSLTGPQHKILDALGWWLRVGVQAPSVGQLAFVAGYHARSKGFTNALSSLSSAGLIERGTGVAELTHDGERAARMPDVTPDDQALQELIFQQLKPVNERVLRAILEHPDGLPTDELAELMDYHPRSKGFTNAVSALSGLGLVDRSKGYVRASSLCFVR